MSSLATNSVGTVSGSESIPTTYLVNGVAKATGNTDISSGTPAIRDSFNLSSVSDLGVGGYKYNLSSSMASIDYTAVGAGSQQATRQGMICGVFELSGTPQIPLAGSFDVQHKNTGGTNGDTDYANIVVFGELAP